MKKQDIKNCLSDLRATANLCSDRVRQAIVRIEEILDEPPAHLVAPMTPIPSKNIGYVGIRDIVGTLGIRPPASDQLERLGYGPFAKFENSDKPSLLDLIKDEDGAYVKLLDTFDPKLAMLATSIELFGMLNPVLLRPAEGGYEIVMGQRRILAAGYNQIKNKREVAIPAIVREITNETALAMNLSRYMMAQAISPMEIAKVLKNYKETSGLPPLRMAQALGIDSQLIRQHLEYCKLPPIYQEKLHEGRISPAKALGIVKDLRR